jgi:Glutathione S-transferase, N-terminal domain
MGVIKVYGVARYMSVARVIACLEEVGADYEVVPVDFAIGENKAPAHLTRNVPLTFSLFHFNFQGRSYVRMPLFETIFHISGH